jgi:Protein of unknown function (DUF3572)
MENDRRRGARQGNAQARKAAASELAVAALMFIAADDERLATFLALSGIGPDSLRAAARDPDFLLGVLDHVAGDEALLVAFAEHSEIDPADIGRARDVLAGEPSQ